MLDSETYARNWSDSCDAFGSEHQISVQSWRSAMVNGSAVMPLKKIGSVVVVGKSVVLVRGMDAMVKWG